jgi:catechol 2,3-dioxygenase-like lactoylglutathione lyase family enzyme
MITKLSHATVWVHDQDEARAFYTDILGFEVRTDQTMDGFRWLTVGPPSQPDIEIMSRGRR